MGFEPDGVEFNPSLIEVIAGDRAELEVGLGSRLGGEPDLRSSNAGNVGISVFFLDNYL